MLFSFYFVLIYKPVFTVMETHKIHVNKEELKRTSEILGVNYSACLVFFLIMQCVVKVSSTPAGRLEGYPTEIYFNVQFCFDLVMFYNRGA